MICLDTNYLILGVVPGSQESKELIQWYQAGEALMLQACITSLGCHRHKRHACYYVTNWMSANYQVLVVS